tara:strand:- start:15 stop:443 length:429 start_codon:yes stop_codon:yes gene_type:complete
LRKHKNIAKTQKQVAAHVLTSHTKINMAHGLMGIRRSKMRKVTRESIDALYAFRKYKSGNTKVVVVDGCRAVLSLHGTPLVKLTLGIGWQDTEITTGGYNTSTTKERLNGVPGVHVYHSKHQLYLNGKEWDGEWVAVEDWSE